jgi:hypothetical protein
MFGIIKYIISLFQRNDNSPTPPIRSVDSPSHDQFHEENQNVSHRQKRYLEFRYIDFKNNTIYSSTPAILSK